MNPQTVRTDRPRWFFGLRNFAMCLVFGGLGVFAYAMLAHRSDGLLWGGLLFASLVSAVLGTLFPRRRR
ncbi:hypothetical protein [Streptomyces sp. NPDC048665]|uniref:hypothetical protein n=1 Tax=Streptomyces sp. NPDC048665 TaxID=3155490 RepID=UPI00341266C2